MIEIRTSRKDEEDEAGKAGYESEDVDEAEERTFPREYSLTL